MSSEARRLTSRASEVLMNKILEIQNEITALQSRDLEIANYIHAQYDEHDNGCDLAIKEGYALSLKIKEKKAELKKLTSQI